MTALIVGLSGFPHGIIACGFTYLSVILSGEYMFVFIFLKSLMLPLDSKQCSSVQFSSVTQLCPTLQPHESQHTRPPCPSPTPEFTQTHVHRVSDVIQPSHPLSSPSPPAPNPSQHQSFFQLSKLFA